MRKNNHGRNDACFFSAHSNAFLCCNTHVENTSKWVRLVICSNFAESISGMACPWAGCFSSKSISFGPGEDDNAGIMQAQCTCLGGNWKSCRMAACHGCGDYQSSYLGHLSHRKYFRKKTRAIIMSLSIELGQEMTVLIAFSQFPESIMTRGQPVVSNFKNTQLN